MVQKGKKETAEDAILRIARVNRFSIPLDVLRKELARGVSPIIACLPTAPGFEEVGEAKEASGKTQEGIADLFRHWSTARLTLILFFTWFGRS